MHPSYYGTMHVYDATKMLYELAKLTTELTLPTALQGAKTTCTTRQPPSTTEIVALSAVDINQVGKTKQICSTIKIVTQASLNPVLCASDTVQEQMLLWLWHPLESSQTRSTASSASNPNLTVTMHSAAKQCCLLAALTVEAFVHHSQICRKQPASDVRHPCQPNDSCLVACTVKLHSR